MITAYSGQACLGMALLASVLQAMGVKRYLSPVQLAWGQVFFLTLAFALLVYAHVTDQFALLSVAIHSHTAIPLLYKIAGVWGNHEGSMLLWIWILSLYGACLTQQASQKTAPYHFAAPLLGLINFGFIFFLITGCDPFAIADLVPDQGQDMNPLLQDPSLAFHPPCLYLGTAGSVVPFVAAILVLIDGKMPESWVALVYPWVLFAWTFLTLGLVLGSYWAYYELGWGGWWFWDPVENAALMPWLSATALIHALRVLKSAKALRAWTVFLGILTFALCLFGNFLVRSGLLTSVHSFAIDAERGTLLLVICCFLVLPALALYFWRLPRLRCPETPPFFTKAGLIVLMTLFLMCGLATIALGTLYPLILEAWGLKITVGAPYFRATFVPMMLPLLFMLGAAPWLPWKKTVSFSAFHPLFFMFSITLAGIMGLYPVFGISRFLALAALAGAIWAILATLAYAIKNKKYFSGMVFSHLGIGIAVLGIVGSSVGEQEIVKVVKKGESFPVGPYRLTLQDVSLRQGANYQAQRATFLLAGGATLAPEKRFYQTQGIIHGESAIRSLGLHHLYITLGDEYEGQRWSIHAYYKPFMNLLGMGALLVISGGMAAFLKRYRTRGMMKGLQMILFYCCSDLSAFALEAHEQLSDPLLERRARRLGLQILCPSCQGQLLDESPVKSARDLRRSIRLALLKGQTDEEIKAAFIAQFGSQVITHPLVDRTTHFLWFAPWIFLGLGIGELARRANRAAASRKKHFPKSRK